MKVELSDAPVILQIVETLAKAKATISQNLQLLEMLSIRHRFILELTPTISEVQDLTEGESACFMGMVADLADEKNRSVEWKERLLSLVNAIIACIEAATSTYKEVEFENDALAIGLNVKAICELRKLESELRRIDDFSKRIETEVNNVFRDI